MEETPNEGGTPKRFHEIVKEKKPSAESIKMARGYIWSLMANIRRKFPWRGRRTKTIPNWELNQQEMDAIDETIAELIARYRQKAMPSRVTEKAAYQVLNQVRNWVRRRYAELNREVLATNEDLANFAPVVFDQWTELEVEDFEELHELGVIDMVDYYFLLAAYRGVRTTDAVGLLNNGVPKEMKMSEDTGGKILSRARESVQKYIKSFDDNGSPPPKTTKAPEIDPRRKIDQGRLMSAFRFLLRYSV